MNYKLENIGLNLLNAIPLAFTIFALADSVYNDKILAFIFAFVYYVHIFYLLSNSDYLKKENDKLKQQINDKEHI